MKQTSNAIKFLLAQYRAIFKSAYFKGIATAAVVTMGLAAGASANAAVINNSDTWKTAVDAGTAIDGTENNKINISGSGTYNLGSGDKLYITGGNFTVDSGDSDVITGGANYIKASGGALSISGDGTITIDTKQKNLGLFLSASGGGSSHLNVNVGTLNVVAGRLVIRDESGTASDSGSVIAADVINLGGNADERGRIQVFNSGSGTVTIGQTNEGKDLTTQLNFIDDGRIQIMSGKANIVSDVISINDGTITSYSGAETTLNAQQITMTDGWIEPRSGGTLNVDLRTTGEGSTKKAGTWNIQGGDLVIDGTLNLNKGVVTVGDNVLIRDINSDTNSGSIVINAGVDTDADAAEALTESGKAVLQIDSAKLNKFLSGEITVGDETAAKSSVLLASGGALEFTNATDLSKVAFTSGGAAADGKVVVSGSGWVLGENLSVETEGLNDASLSKALSIKATNMTLGSTTYSGGTKLFKSIDTQNVNFVAPSNVDGGYVLADTVNLRSVTDGEGNEIIADDGVISGNFTIGSETSGGAINVNGGKYVANGDITLVSGSLNVTNTGAAASESSLELRGDLVITGAKDFTVSVSGNDTLLDITGASLQAQGTGNSGTTFETSSNGVIKVTGSQVQSILDAVSDSTTSPFDAVHFAVQANGTLDIDGDVTLSYNSTNSSDLSNVITIAKGGTVKANTVTVNGNYGSGAPAGGAESMWHVSGNLELNNLVLNATKTSGTIDSFVLGQGNYKLASGLSSTNSTVVLNGEDALADVTFGAVDSVDANNDGINDYAVGSAGGTVGVATLQVGASGAAHFNSGVWSAQNIVVSGGEVSVGTYENGGAAYETADGTAITAALKGESLNVAAGSFNVTHVGSATFETLNAAIANGVEVEGAMTITGDATPADTTAAENDIKAAANSVQIASTGTLTIGNDALDSVLKINGETINFDQDVAKGSINAAANGTLALDFDSGLTLTSKQLVEIKKHLFADADANGQIQGILNIGKAKIDGLNFTKEADGDLTIKWEDLAPVSDVNSDTTNNQLMSATVTGVNSTFKGQVGAVRSTTGTVTVGGNSSFNNAAANDGYYASAADGSAANVSVTNDSDLALKNGGEIGNISLTGGKATDRTVLNIGGDPTATTVIKSVDGGEFSSMNVAAITQVNGTVRIGDIDVQQNLTVNGALTVRDDIYTAANTKTQVESLTVEEEAGFLGDLVVNGNAEFKGGENSETYFAGNNSFKTVTFHGGVQFDKGNTSAETVTVRAKGADDHGYLRVVGDATVNVGVMQSTGSDKLAILVGEAAGTDEVTGESWEDSTGYLMADRIDLNGGKIQADPDYNRAVSIVTAGGLGDSTATIDADDAGVLNGQAIALRNSILAIGVESSESETAVEQMQDLFSQYIDGADGSLTRDEVGSIIYVAKSLNVDNGSKLILNSTMSHDSYDAALNQADAAYDSELATIIADNDVYLGNNTALAISDVASLNGKTAISFNKADASIYGAGGKIVLTGNFSSRDTINLFADQNGGIAVEGSTIDVETINGLLTQSFKAGDEIGSFNLTLNRERVNTIFTDVSTPVKDTLISYAAGDNNWDSRDPAHADPLVGETRRDISYDATKGYTYEDGTSVDPEYAAQLDYMVVEGENGQTTTVVYEKAYNDFLDQVVRNSTSGRDAETAARLGILGGVAQSAMAAGAATYDAISGRMGVGSSAGNITIANNTQGASLWVTPIYKNSESDGFDADGVDYGVDVDLYGVALGADYTLTNGLRIGAMFNVGSGDADGQGIGSNVSNDFDYYGFGLYAGYTYGALSVVADVTYTVADNDIEGHTGVGGYETISTSLDSTNLSVGVTGQYAFDMGAVEVAPHVGLRFSSIDIDDYNVADIASYDADSLNIFSIPVGVTISREFQGESWTVRPSFDLTLTGNFGDDSADGTVDWHGVENLSTSVSSEVIDNFTYGATLGVAASSGNFSLGLGVNYTGSSNVDDYGVSANARFVF